MDIGPLLGKGSYGRVYKGRWKGAMVAIKVLDHALILQDDISRETLLSTSIAHPCVVSPQSRLLSPACAGVSSFRSERAVGVMKPVLNSKPALFL